MTLSKVKRNCILVTSALFILSSQIVAGQQQSILVAAVSDGFDAAQSYKQFCAACHDTGAAHAPELGDVIEWEIRLEKGLDVMVQNAINGLNGVMPPRGLCASCSDDDLNALVDYMLKNSK